MSQSFEFGEFRLELEERRLLCQGNELSLPPKVFDTLVLLVQNPGHLITKDEFLKRIWPDTFVGEDTLAQNISVLRKTLCQTASAEGYVATVPRRGYRFVADVKMNPVVCQFASGIAPADTDHRRQRADLWPSGQPAPEHLSAPETERLSFRSGWIRIAVVSSIVGVVAGLAAFAVLRTSAREGIKVTSFAQLTSDGRPKGGPLGTDGTRVYATEYLPGEDSSLIQVSISGGEATSFKTPFRMARLADISRDGTELLLMVQEISGPPSLWIQSAVSGTTRRVGLPVVDNASWGPNDQTIAYTKGRDIYLAMKDGTLARRLLSLPGTPSGLRFSPDGSELRFKLADPEGHNTLLWEASADGSEPHPLLPGWNPLASECCGSWTSDGRYFLFESQQNGRRDLWALRENSARKGGSRYVPEQLTAGPINFSDPIASKDRRELFAVGSVRRAEVVRYDLREHRFIPYLAGLSAEGLDFSRDGNWVTYVSYPEGTLWRSRLDGTDRTQLTFPPMRVLLPRWSPNGKLIAFLGSPPAGGWILGGPWKIYLVPADGGSPQQLLPGVSNESDPTWSPDGNSIAFGSLPWPETFAEDHRDLNIQIVDLQTHQLSKVPGSEGFFSPRWSPDGRYIIASNSSHPIKPRLFDRATRKWTSLAESEMGYPSWSHDGKYLYMQDWNKGRPRIVRLRLRDRQMEGLVYFDQVGSSMVGTIAPWSGVAPDGSPLVARDVSSYEIYALKLRTP